MAGQTNIGFVATRLRGTDGVSLETAKWAAVLEREGSRCSYLAGESDRDPEVCEVVPLAHFEHPEIAELQAALFGATTRERGISLRVDAAKHALKEALAAYVERFDIDVLIAENALTIPMHVPLGLALTEYIAETGIRTIAHHHDFAWERDRFRINACGDHLAMAFPPDLPTILHVVINSHAAEQLSHRRGLSNALIPNVYDFALPRPDGARTPALREAVGLAPGEPFVLQPTRVVPRKWIERAVEIVRDLSAAAAGGAGHPTLVISHASGDEGDAYLRRLEAYARSLGVRLRGIGDLVGAGGDGRPFTVGDAYEAADLVTYTSGYEGFGNAFVESVYHCRPIVVNRYAVYVADIEPKGFDVISVDGFATAEAIAEIRHVLDDPERRRAMTERNVELGRRHYSFEVLEKRLTHLLSRFD